MSCEPRSGFVGSGHLSGRGSATSLIADPRARLPRDGGSRELESGHSPPTVCRYPPVREDGGTIPLIRM
jgi:hypothetical protein